MQKNLQSKTNKTLDYIKGNWQLYLFLLPGIAFLLVFNIIPFRNITIAFKQFKPMLGLANSPWVGLAHFKKLFSDPAFYRIIKNTFEINMLMLVFVTPISMFLAILINEVTQRGLQRAVQTIIYIPHFFTWVVIYSVFYIMFGSDGIVTEFLQKITGSKILFFVDGNWFRVVLVISQMWTRVGWGTIIYLSALTQIDSQLYDAAIVDGANKWQQIIHITLPSLLPVFILMVTIKLGSIMTDGFGQILVFYNPSVYDSADVIGTFVYREGLGRANFSYATAVGLFESVVGLVLVLFSNFLSKKLTGKRVW